MTKKPTRTVIFVKNHKAVAVSNAELDIIESFLTIECSQLWTHKQNMNDNVKSNNSRDGK